MEMMDGWMDGWIDGWHIFSTDLIPQSRKLFLHSESAPTAFVLPTWQQPGQMFSDEAKANNLLD